MDRESAYFRLQFTRPETITYAPADSPVGWAAYMLDKRQKRTDTRERAIDDIYGRDRILTEVMLFLVTDTVATSTWPYAGFATEPFGLQPGQKITVPFGYSSFPDEPTRGIDVGAQAEVHNLLFKMAQSGIAIIVISPELPEVLALADRIVTMREGRVTGEVMGPEAAQEKLMTLMTLGVRRRRA